ncbi:MAG: oligosaccharide flippase family protein [Candidatus Nanohaloarchaea archaeon]
MSYVTQLAKGAGITFIGMVASKILSFAYRTFLGRTLGPEQYGLFALALAGFFLAQNLATLSLDQAVKKFMPEQLSPEHTFQVLYSSLRVALPLSLLTAVGLFFGAPLFENFLEQGLSMPLKILAIVVPFGVLSGIVVPTFASHNRMQYTVITNHLFQNSLKLATAIAAVSLGMGLAGVIWGFALSVFLSSLLAVYFVVEKVGVEFSVPEDKPTKKYVRYSWPLFFSGLIGFVLGWTDTVMLGYYLDSAQVGIYNAAFPLAQVLTVFLGATGSINLPLMSKLYSKGKLGEINDFYQTNTRWILTFTAPAFLVLFLFPEPVLALTFGREYVSGALALRILSAGFFIAAAAGPVEQLLKTTERTSFVLYNNAVAAGGNVVLNVALIPVLGLPGAAAASLASRAFSNIAGLVENFYLDGIHPFHRDLVPVVAASIVSVAITYATIKTVQPVTPLRTLIPGAVLFGLVYGLTLWALGGIKEEDREVIVGTFRKIKQEELGEKLAELLIR